VSYDITELWELIVTLVAAPGNIAPRMQKLIDYCAAAIPHDQWTKLRYIDYDAESSSYLEWLTDLTAAARGQSPKGLWFGLVNPVRNGSATLDLYGATSTEYDSNGLVWAERISRSTRCFAGSRVLAEIYSCAYGAENSLENDAEYPLGLGFGAMIARSILEASPLTAPLDQIAGAAMGFDSGDVLYLGEVFGGRFNARVRAG
jgi:hypothetical protein